MLYYIPYLYVVLCIYSRIEVDVTSYVVMNRV